MVSNTPRRLTMPGSKRYRAEGRCERCGKPKAANRHACPECLAYLCTKQRQWQADRRTRGLCRRCGGSLEDKRAHCQACLAHLILLKKRRRKRALDAYGGKCVCCGETAFEF